MRKLREAGFEVQEFVACGGATKSRMWTQMHSDVTGIPITLTGVGDAVTLGSCIPRCRRGEPVRLGPGGCGQHGAHP